MLTKDNFLTGVIMGLVFPAIFYFIFLEANELLKGTLLPEEQGFSDQFIAILAVCMNLFPFFGYNYAKKGNAMRGILGTTIALAFIVIIVYHDEFL